MQCGTPLARFRIRTEHRQAMSTARREFRLLVYRGDRCARFASWLQPELQTNDPLDSGDICRRKSADTLA